MRLPLPFSFHLWFAIYLLQNNLHMLYLVELMNELIIHRESNKQYMILSSVRLQYSLLFFIFLFFEGINFVFYFVL